MKFPESLFSLGLPAGPFRLRQELNEGILRCFVYTATVVLLGCRRLCETVTLGTQSSEIEMNKSWLSILLTVFVCWWGGGGFGVLGLRAGIRFEAITIPMSSRAVGNA